jgi:16S rRNA (guanine527-N7)-methyltransferase
LELFPKQICRDWTHEIGIDLSERELHLFDRYLVELWEWNQKINLVGLTSILEIVRDLLIDSLIAVPHLPPEGNLLDVGSGAGFPGVPIKICKDALRVDLVDARAKRVSFLKHVVRVLGLEEVRVIRGRIEESSSDVRQRDYSVVTARAVAGLSQTLAWCEPHLVAGGKLITYRGEEIEEELENNHGTMARLGLSPYKILPYRLPEKQSRRHLIIFEKTAESPTAIP